MEIELWVGVVVVIVAFVLRLATKAIWKEQVQDSLSETERGERLGVRPRTVTESEKGPLGVGKGEMSTELGARPRTVTESEKGPPGFGKGEMRTQKGQKTQHHPREQGESLSYPWKDLANLRLEGTSGDSSPSLENELLDPGDKLDLEKEADEPNDKPGRAQKSGRQAGRRQRGLGPLPTAPPLYNGDGANVLSPLPDQARRKLCLAFPVFEGDGARIHAPVEFSQIKELAESVCKYGVSANFTETAREQARVNATALTPEQQLWTFAGFVHVTPLSGEKATHVIQNCLEAWSAWGKPQCLKIDNGPAYLLKQKGGSILDLPMNPRILISLALFTVNF